MKSRVIETAEVSKQAFGQTRQRSGHLCRITSQVEREEQTLGNNDDRDTHCIVMTTSSSAIGSAIR